MDVLLIEPKSSAFRMIPSIPLGIQYIASMLEQAGHSPHLATIHTKKDLEHYFNKYSPAIVGITCGTPLVPKVIELSRDIKNIAPDVFLIVGGAHPTIRPQDLLSADEIDCVAIGESEYTILELSQKIDNNQDWHDVPGIAYKKNGEIKRSPSRPLITDLDALPFPAKHLIPHYETMLKDKWKLGIPTRKSDEMIAGRGCPFRCIFCESHVIHGYKVRYRSPENVVQEMKYLEEHFGLDHISFNDDTLTMNKEWTYRFAEAYHTAKCKVKWTCQTRVDAIDDNIVKTLKKAGMVFMIFGLESHSDKILKIIRKGTTPEQQMQAMKIVKKYHIKSASCFMLGVLGETDEDIQITKNFIKKSGIEFAHFVILTPFPGTDIWYIAEQHGWIPDTIDWEQWNFTESMPIKMNRDEEKLFEKRRELQKWFFFRYIVSLLSNFNAIQRAVSMVFRNFHIFGRAFKNNIITHFDFFSFFREFLQEDRKKYYL